MAGVAKHQRLAASGCHDLDPLWFFSSIVCVQVFQCSNMMHFHLICKPSGSTDFTCLGEEPFFQFGSPIPGELGSLIRVGLNVPDQRDCSPGSDQWFLSLAWDGYLKYFVFPSIYFDFSSVLFVNLSHRGLVFVCERFYQRLFHDPFELVEGMQVVRQAVVFDDSPIFELVR